MHDIRTKQEAEDHFIEAYVVPNKELFIQKIKVNNGLATKIITNKNHYYVKFEQYPKWLDQYTQKRQVYHSINKDLMSIPFGFLIIIDRKGRIFKINKQQIDTARLEGYVMTTESQSETVIHIPNEWAERIA